MDVFSLVRELRLARERTVETPVSKCWDKYGLLLLVFYFFLICLFPGAVYFSP